MVRTEAVARNQVDVRSLKALATGKLADGSILRGVLLSEPDSMPAEDFVAKIGTWLAILREETAT